MIILVLSIALQNVECTGICFLITAENQEKYLIFEKKLVLYIKSYSNR